MTQQLVDLFSRVLKGGELATEAQKCSKSGKEIGCEVKNLSPENKVALALVYSMLPSFSELKERVKDKFLEPGRMVRIVPCIVPGDPKKHSCLKVTKILF